MDKLEEVTGGVRRRRQQEKVSTRKEVRKPQSAQQLLCLIIFYAVAASSFFLLHFIWQIVYAYIQNWEAGLKHHPLPQEEHPALTADWNVEGNFRSPAKWEGILGIGSGREHSIHTVSAHLCIQVSVRYIRIYGVIKRVSFYLSVGPKLFVTPNASLNDISCLLATVGWDRTRGTWYLSISLPQLWLMASVSLMLSLRCQFSDKRRCFQIDRAVIYAIFTLTN